MNLQIIDGHNGAIEATCAKLCTQSSFYNPFIAECLWCSLLKFPVSGLSFSVVLLSSAVLAWIQVPCLYLDKLRADSARYGVEVLQELSERIEISLRLSLLYCPSCLNRLL